MNRLRALLEQTWREKPAGAVDAPYTPGANLRVEAAARWLRDGERLLDLGCGAGVLGGVLAKRFGEVHGIDLSERAVRAAEQRGVHAQVWDLNEVPLPYDDGAFDAVMLLSVIQYVFDPACLLREVARILRPGGQACIGFPNMRSLQRLFRLVVLGRFPQVSRDPGYDGGTIHYFCRRDVERLLAHAELLTEMAVGVFTRPRRLEGLGDGVRLFAGLKREFLSAEILVLARKAVV